MNKFRPKIRTRQNRSGTISWCVDAGFSNNKRLRWFFKTKAEATSYADKITINRKNHGDAAFALTDEQRLEAVAALGLLAGTGATLRQAVQYYVDHVHPKRGSRTLTEIAAELVELKRKKGFKFRYVKALRVAFNVFNRVFGSRPANTIEPKEIESWLDDQPYTANTKRNYLRDVGILFRYAVDQGDCLKAPTTKIDPPKADDPLPSIFKVETIAVLLTVAHSNPQHELLSGLAVGFFAGLRSCELEKLTWDEINLADSFIEVKAEKSKTRTRRLVDVSANLAEWLRLHPQQKGFVLPVNWRRRLASLLTLAGISKWPKNVMRHCYASYHLAEHKSAGLTALQLGHADTDMLFNHYREIVRGTEANNYWKIAPAQQATSTIELALAL